MDTNTLHEANNLSWRIKELANALNCFEYEHEAGQEPISTNPQLIIEFDGGDDREQIKLPINLSQTLTDFLKVEIKKELGIAIDALEAL